MRKQICSRNLPFARRNVALLCNARTVALLSVLALTSALACSDETVLGPLADPAGSAGIAGAAGKAGAPTNAGNGGNSATAGASGAADNGGSAGDAGVGNAGAGGTNLAEAGAAGASAGAAGSDAQGGSAGLSGIAGSAGANADMTVTSHKTLRDILYGKGAPLYVSGADVPGDATNAALSRCIESACTSLWAPFHLESPTVSGSLKAQDFAEIVRPDGAKQTTYQGWPLYTYTNEVGTAPAGEGYLTLWHAAAVPSYTLAILKKESKPGEFITYLGDNEGMAIYTYESDTPAAGATSPVSACNLKCLNNWPPVTSTQLRLVSSLDAKNFGFFVRPDTSAVQLTYKGWPLYRYAKDLKPGDTVGNTATLWRVAVP